MTSHVSKGSICINEPFLVSFEIHTQTDSFQKQQFPGFKILKGPAYTYGHSYKDRKIKHSEMDEYAIDTTYSSGLKYLLIPVRSGQLIIHGAVFYCKNKEVSTPDTFIEVTETMLKATDSIKTSNELWPESKIEKMVKEKVDSVKIDVIKIKLASDFNEKKVKLNETFTINYKLNYLLFNKIVTDFSDFEIIQPQKINIECNEVHAEREEESYNSNEVNNYWVCVIKPKKKGTFIIKPAVMYIKGQLVKSNEIKIIVR